MQNHQSQGILKLKIPSSLKSKGKRPTEEPIHQIQNFFSNNNTRQRNQSQKDEYVRTPPTPNLQFIKQNKMRHNVRSGHNSSKLLIHKSLNDYDDTEDQVTTHYSSRMVCPSHPNKRAKYFLASNTNVKFCTKCAITMAEREPILDQQKYQKITEIDKFRDTIKIVKQEVAQRQPQAVDLCNSLQDIYRQATIEIDEHFDSVSQLMKSKQSQILKSLQSKYVSAKNTLKAYQQDIQAASTAVEKYLFDVNRNYDDIVQDLGLSHFNQIMEQYQAKICGYIQRINSPPSCEISAQPWLSKLVDIKDMFKRLSLEERLKSPINAKQNMMLYNNQTQKHKSKTPDRVIR